MTKFFFVYQSKTLFLILIYIICHIKLILWKKIKSKSKPESNISVSIHWNLGFKRSPNSRLASASVSDFDRGFPKWNLRSVWNPFDAHSNVDIHDDRKPWLKSIIIKMKKISISFQFKCITNFISEQFALLPCHSKTASLMLSVSESFLPVKFHSAPNRIFRHFIIQRIFHWLKIDCCHFL